MPLFAVDAGYFIGAPAQQLLGYRSDPDSACGNLGFATPP
jgi:hypothetical protein